MDKKQQGMPVPVEQAQSFWLGRVWEARQADGTRNVVPTEARQTLRRRSGSDVLINHGLSYSIPWQVRDLSLQGAFVEADSGQLPAGSTVEVVMRYHYKDQDVEVRLPATVTRVDARGMALKFGRYDNQTYTDLTNLLFAL
jgi:hypothetical protein